MVKFIVWAFVACFAAYIATEVLGYASGAFVLVAVLIFWTRTMRNHEADRGSISLRPPH